MVMGKLCILFSVDLVSIGRTSILLRSSFKKLEENQDLISWNQPERENDGRVLEGLDEM